MKNIRYICCQPAIPYYTWQVEVVIQNFKKMGVNPNYIDIVCGIENNVIPEVWRKLRLHYNTVRFFFYNDTRTDKRYIPSIYFNLMKQHVAARPEIQNDVLFLHDSDIILTKTPNFQDMTNDNVWYLSDTNSYINYDYIQSKGGGIYDKMCEIIGINKLIPKLMNLNSGGAQYIVKNTTYEFWDKVENDSHKLYEYFCSVEHLYVKKNEFDYPIQKWTAGMWSLLWNAWLFGHETVVDKRMSFCWSTDKISELENHSILHNSGVIAGVNDLFVKSDFINELPYNKELNINKDYASYYYWQTMCETAKNSILLPSIDQTFESISNTISVESIIKDQLKKNKISQLQLDPNGVCNAKCWYCPVKYIGNPVEGRETMSVELLEKIIKNLIDEREKPDGLVSKQFNGFYSAHYNEILMYPYFEEMLELCRKYHLRTMILTNGTTLTPAKVDLIKKYSDVISGICLNIPAFDAETWSKRSGLSITKFDLLIANINYTIRELPDMVRNKEFSIQINGVHELSFSEKGGWLEKGKDLPSDIDLDVENGEIIQQEKKAKELFPGVNIFSVPNLIDVAGSLNNVITNRPAIEKKLKLNVENKKVIGCANFREVGGRPIGWLHVNAAGNAFLCCNDYNFNIKLGNFNTQELSDFWGTEKHAQKIEYAYTTICRNCISAIFEN